MKSTKILCFITEILVVRFRLLINIKSYFSENLKNTVKFSDNYLTAIRFFVIIAKNKYLRKAVYNTAWRIR